jgi:pimeloyl-ACP methyl ester carboxylesterase
MATTPKSQSATVRKNGSLGLSLISASLRIGGTVAPGATSAVVKRLLFAPQKGRVRENEAQILQGATTTRHVLGNDTVCHYEWGSGARRILLVHGWSGHAGQMTSFVKPLLAAGYHVIALDLPAHGKSPGKTASVVHFKRAVLHAMQLYGPFHGVVAHSLGAASIALAISEGLLCERVVFLGAVTRYGPIWEQSKKMLGITPRVMDLVILRAEKWLGVHFDDISPERLAPSFSSELLIVHDRGDYEVPLEGAQALAACWPKAQIVVTEKLGHVKLLHDPGIVQRSVTFLNEGHNPHSETNLTYVL